VRRYDGYLKSARLKDRWPLPFDLALRDLSMNPAALRFTTATTRAQPRVAAPRSPKRGVGEFDGIACAALDSFEQRATMAVPLQNHVFVAADFSRQPVAARDWRGPLSCSDHASGFSLIEGESMKDIGKIDLGDGVKISNVLLVEDSPGDVRLTQEAFRAANPSVSLHVANDGVEAMIFLRKQNGHANSPRPDMILLDLNMPRMDGRQVLAEIKKDDKLKTIPTVILTTSEAEVDVAKSYQLQANCYLTKPVQLDAFEDLVKSINEFWLTTVRLPQKRNLA
jgi:chemotaxis family two-component system response regulator Rcp1